MPRCMASGKTEVLLGKSKQEFKALTKVYTKYKFYTECSVSYSILQYDEYPGDFWGGKFQKSA